MEGCMWALSGVRSVPRTERLGNGPHKRVFVITNWNFRNFFPHAFGDAFELLFIHELDQACILFFNDVSFDL